MLFGPSEAEANAVMLPIEQSCFWLATRRENTVSPLGGNVDAEILIVGGGFTGLWTAFFLKQLDPKLDIALVEQGTVGYGGSGRNAGMVMPTMDHSHGLAVSHFGLDEARRMAGIGLKNIDELAEYAVDCDFERTGLLVAALTPKHIEECHANVQVAG